MFIQGYLRATTKKRMQNMSDEAGMTNDESMTKRRMTKKPHRSVVISDFVIRHSFVIRH